MRIGNLALRRYSPETAEDTSHYMARLNELAAILHGTDWYLGGGLAIPLTVGHFFRPHYDVDLLFPVEAFEAVDAAMRRGGFSLLTYFPMSMHNRLRFALDVHMRPGGWMARRRLRKLKFADATGRRPHPNLLGMVECLPFRIVNGTYATCDQRHTFPLKKPLVGHVFRTTAGHTIRCIDLDYVLRLKNDKFGPKDLLDREVVRSYREASARGGGAPASRASSPMA